MDLREFIIKWNNDNPLDRMFREKYNIPFNSPQHRELNQIDICLEFIESDIFSSYMKDAKIEIEKEEEYQKGRWLKEREISKVEEENLFAKIDVGKFNSQNSSIEIEE